MADKPIGKFPSPIGELHFSIANKVVVRLYEKVSVPYRGATFLNQYEDVSKLDGETVSVPYRGATFLNIDIGLLFPVAFVSVPYRGATFLNSLYKDNRITSSEFPSPIGELHFSMWRKSL